MEYLEKINFSGFKSYSLYFPIPISDTLGPVSNTQITINPK